MSKLISFILLFTQLCFTQILVNPRRAAVINPPVTGVTPFYTMDFEEGDGSDLGGVGANTTITDVSAHSGNYGMEIDAANTGAESYFAFTDSTRDNVYVTFWIYVPESTTFSGGAYSYSTWFYSGNTGTDRTMFGGHSLAVEAEYKWTTWMVGKNSSDFADNSTNFSRDIWHKVKMHYTKGTGSNGVAQIWVDDDEVYNNTGSNFTDKISGLHITIYQPAVATGSIYWDDFKFYDTDPGTQD